VAWNLKCIIRFSVSRTKRWVLSLSLFRAESIKRVLTTCQHQSVAYLVHLRRLWWKFAYTYVSTGQRFFPPANTQFSPLLIAAHIPLPNMIRPHKIRAAYCRNVYVCFFFPVCKSRDNVKCTRSPYKQWLRAFVRVSGLSRSCCLHSNACENNSKSSRSSKRKNREEDENSLLTQRIHMQRF